MNSFGYYKQLIKTMILSEEYHTEEERRESTSDLIGTVNNIDIRLETQLYTSCAMLSTDDNISIQLTPNDVSLLFLNRPGFNAIVAHELGHIENGDLIHKSDLLFYHDKNINASIQQNYNRYMIRVQKNLIKGDFLDREYRADVRAMQYVSKDDIIKMHLNTLKDINNFVAKTEKINRITHLLSEDEPLIKKSLNVKFVKEKMSIFEGLGFTLEYI